MISDRTSMGHNLAAHVLTVAVTLLAVAVLFGGRLGLMRKPPVAQIPVLYPGARASGSRSPAPRFR